MGGRNAWGFKIPTLVGVNRGSAQMELVQVTSYSVVVSLTVDEAALLAQAARESPVAEQAALGDNVYALAGFLDAVRWLPLAFGEATPATLRAYRAAATARGWPWIGDPAVTFND